MAQDYTKLLNAIDAAEASSYGSDSEGELSAQRAGAIERYLGQNTYPAPEGTSQVVSRDVFDTINWIMPSLTRIFTTSEDICVFEPSEPGDEQAADQESAYTSYTIQRLNPWFQVCHDWFMDALMTKNAYCMVYWDTTQQVEKEKYERQSPESIAKLMEDKTLELVEADEYPDPDYVEPPPQQGVDPMTGQPVMMPPPPPPMVYDVVVKKVRQEGYPKLCVLPPERVKVGHRTASFQLRDCDYFEYWEMRTISTLRAMGLDIPDDIADDGGETDTEEDEARDQFGEDVADSEDISQVDPSMRRVKARMVWIRHDTDEDGIAELQYCIIVGRNVLYREECGRIPVSSIVPAPLPHRHVGLSVDDMISDIQEIKTMMLRQGINNLYLANNPRTFVSDKVNLDDLLVSRPGGVVRVEDGGIPSQEAVTIPIPNVFPQAMQGLDYFDSVRQNRAGVNSYFTGLDQNSLNRTASGVAQLTSSAAQRVEQIARVFAAGVEELFSLVHEQILKHGHKQQVVRLRGQWAVVDPRTWKTRKDLRINVGMGTGNREQLMAHLQMIFAMQMQTLPLNTTTPRHVANTLAEIEKAAGFSSNGKFFVPSDQVQAPPPPPPDPKLIELEQKPQIEAAKMQADQRIEAMRLETQKAIEAARLDMQKYMADLDAQVKLYVQQAGVAAQEQSQARQLEYDSAKTAAEQAKTADGDAKVDGLAQATSQIMQNLQIMAQRVEERLESVSQTLNAPKRVIREGGRVVGVEINGVVRPVERDQNGQVIGLQ